MILICIEVIFISNYKSARFTPKSLVEIELRQTISHLDYTVKPYTHLLFSNCVFKLGLTIVEILTIIIMELSEFSQVFRQVI